MAPILKKSQKSVVEVLEVTLVVCGLFEDLSIPYVVGGSLASSAHGVPRSTNDVDVVAALPLHMADSLYERARQDFYLDIEAVRVAIRSSGSFNMVHLETLFKVDIFIPSEKPVSLSQLENRVPLQLGGAGNREIFVLSPEDAVLQKLLWFDLGDRVSERQWSDVIGILKTKHGKLDMAFLGSMAARSGLGDLLERAVEEVEG